MGALVSLAGEMKQILAEMTLLSHGKTQSFDATGGKSENPDPRPQGEMKPPHEYWAERWRQRPEHGTVVAAREALNAWKKRTAPAVGDGSSEDDWIVKDGRGFTPVDVARRFNTTPSRVRNLRKAEKLDTETGFKLGEAEKPLVSDEERIRNLAAQGCTERQIAFQVGKPKSTVRRALGRAA